MGRLRACHYSMAHIGVPNLTTSSSHAPVIRGFFVFGPTNGTETTTSAPVSASLIPITLPTLPGQQSTKCGPQKPACGLTGLKPVYSTRPARTGWRRPYSRPVDARRKPMSRRIFNPAPISAGTTTFNVAAPSWPSASSINTHGANPRHLINPLNGDHIIPVGKSISFQPPTAEYFHAHNRARSIPMRTPHNHSCAAIAYLCFGRYRTIGGRGS